MSSNTRTARNRNISLLLVMPKAYTMLNIIDPTSLNTTITSLGIAKQTLRPTLHALKPNKENHALIYSNT